MNTFVWRGKRRMVNAGGRKRIEWVTLNLNESAYDLVALVSRRYQCTLNCALLMLLDGPSAAQMQSDCNCKRRSGT